jgi:3-hydroxymyristoyl/3-hydroxydecanoyl-(acyl carrier protein) dehydratase
MNINTQLLLLDYITDLDKNLRVIQVITNSLNKNLTNSKDISKRGPAELEVKLNLIRKYIKVIDGTTIAVTKEVKNNE